MFPFKCRESGDFKNVTVVVVEIVKQTAFAHLVEETKSAGIQGDNYGIGKL